MRTVVIIGAGFSGAITAARLLTEAGTTPLRVVLINRSGLLARGVAYGTRTEDHVLNVPAGRMSAYAERPQHFLQYAQTRKANVQAGDFVPRQLFGDYLESLLDEASRRAVAGREFRAMVGTVVDIQSFRQADGRSSARVLLDRGMSIDADCVVLALGNFAPVDPRVDEGDDGFYSSPRYIRDPWAPDALWAVKPDKPVLLLGTGLTMLDVVLSLRARGVTAPIHAVSRRGLMPLSHRDLDNPPEYRGDLADAIAQSSQLSEALRRVRDEVRRSAQLGVDWRDVIGSLRAATPALWARLSATQRQRFMRHLRVHWDVHRHRCAPELGAQLAAERCRGGLQIHKGRLLCFRESSAGVEAMWRRRSDGLVETLACGTVINCTGPAGDTRRMPGTLIAQLRERGEVQPDAMGLGLQLNSQYQLLSATGQASPVLYYVGPFLRAQFWEATAVPELREHCAKLARQLLDALALTASATEHAALTSPHKDQGAASRCAA